MPQTRARIVTPYPTVDTVTKAFAVSKSRARKIVKLIDRLVIDGRTSRGSKSFPKKLRAQTPHTRRRIKT